MVCPHCGNYLSGIAKICPMCGKALKKNQEDDRIDQQWKEKLQYTPPSYDPGPDRRPLIALIIVIVVLIVAGGTGAVLYSLKKNGQGPEENVQTYEDPVEGVQDPQGAQEPSQEQEQVPADSLEQTQQQPQDPEQHSSPHRIRNRRSSPAPGRILMQRKQETPTERKELRRSPILICTISGRSLKARNWNCTMRSTKSQRQIQKPERKKYL